MQVGQIYEVWCDDYVSSFIPSTQVYYPSWLGQILKLGEVARLFCGHHSPECLAADGDVDSL